MDDVKPGTLDAIGLRYAIKQASDKRDLLNQHQTVIDAIPMPITDIVLVLGVGAVGIANTIAEYLPDAAIHLLTVHPVKDPARLDALRSNVIYQHCARIRDRVRYLSQIPAPQMILENGNNHKGQKLACFRQLLLFLPPGGIYVIEELRAVAIEKLNDCCGANVVELLNQLNLLRLSAGTPEQPDDVELAGSIEAITFRDDVAYIHKRGMHRIKLREREANETLNRRFGATWGRVMETIPEREFASACEVINHGAGPAVQRKMIRVPERSLREYVSSVCLPRQRAVLCGYYLPDTFRHPMQSRLNNRELVNASPYLDRSDREPASAVRLDGQYFYFDTEYPGHFGHVTTEVVGRYWGWAAAREANPDIKPLISLDPGAESIPSFQKAIFAALDVPVSEIEYIRPGCSVEVESLVAATPAFAMPHYADDSLAAVWSGIAQQLIDPTRSDHELIFSSRRPSKIRTCLNSAQVEEFFAGLGFKIIYPEDHSFAEQVNLFAGARVVAGFGGSNMFCTMFAPRTTKIVLAGESYTANNEHLIASVVGGDLHYVWGRSQIAHPKGGWSWAAFQSNFTVDLARLESEIKAVVNQ